ncbi:hypothetical protein [Glycomyces tarimensis]
MNGIEWHGRDRIDLGTQLLDRQITAPEAVPVGKVDDIELTRRDDGTVEVTALWVGTSALTARLPRWEATVLRWAMRLTGGPFPARRIGLEDVVDVESDVEVTERAAERAMSRSERKFRKFVARIPGAGHAGE